MLGPNCGVIELTTEVVAWEYITAFVRSLFPVLTTTSQVLSLPFVTEILLYKIPET
jgi:hypothetical protein